MLGSSYWSISPSSHGKSDDDEASSVPIGFDDDAAYLGGWRERLVDLVMAAAGSKTLPRPKIGNTPQFCHCFGDVTLSLISVWHPSFLALLLDAMLRSWDMLLADVRGGTCTSINRIPPSVAIALEADGDPEARRIESCRSHCIGKAMAAIGHSELLGGRSCRSGCR